MDTVTLVQRSAAVYQRAVPGGERQLMRIARALLGAASAYQQVELDELPVELLDRIQSDLDPTSRARLSATSRQMRDITARARQIDKGQWYRAIQREFGYPYDYADDVGSEEASDTLRQWTVTFPGGDQLSVQKSPYSSDRRTEVWESNDEQKLRVIVDRSVRQGILEMNYYRDQQQHRTDGPQRIQWYEDGQLRTVEYKQDDRLYRKDGPASLSFYPNGQRMFELWYTKPGELHRINGPADISYHSNGTPSVIAYYVDDEQHREGGPAYARYDDQGNVQEEQYFRHGELHRDDGPAVVSFDEDGNVDYTEYYRNGQPVVGEKRSRDREDNEYGFDNKRLRRW